MKAAKGVQKAGQAEQPGLDEIITISKEGGKPEVKLKKAGTAEATASADAEKQRISEAKASENSSTDAGKEAPKKKPAARKAKPEPKIKTKRPKAEPEKEKAVDEKVAYMKADRQDDSNAETLNAESRPSPVIQSKAALAEAALFLSPRPLMLDELAKITGVSSLGYVKELLESLKSQYEGRGIEIANTSSGWQMQVRPEYLGAVAHLAPYADLSEGPKRALALILFKEPMKQSDLIRMQGNKVYDYLKVLEKMGMIKREPSGRTKILTLTKEFERYFGEEKDAIKERLAQELAMHKPAANAGHMTPAKMNMEDDAE